MNTTLQPRTELSNHLESPQFVPTRFDQKIMAASRPSNELGFWKIVGRAVFVGPLIGGLPYLWALFPIAFAYLFGAGPALIGGACFAIWLKAGGPPNTMLGAAFGALFGAVGCIVAAIGSPLISTPSASFEAARLALV